MPNKFNSLVKTSFLTESEEEPEVKTDTEETEPEVKINTEETEPEMKQEKDMVPRKFAYTDMPI